MAKIAPLIGLAAVLLFVPATAQAKEISKLSICGPSSCASITDPALLQQWMQADDGQSAPPAAVAPFLRLETTGTAASGETFDGGTTSVTWSDFYIPSAGVIRGTSERNLAAWTRLGSRAAEIGRGQSKHRSRFFDSLAKFNILGRIRESGRWLRRDRRRPKAVDPNRLKIKPPR